jgi:RHS repeat-associated protein
MGSVTDHLAPGGALSATYAYLPNSDLLWTTTTNQGGNERLKVTRSWDSANRLEALATTRAAASVASHTWRYDAAGRRERATLADDSYWEYGYNDRNEVTGGTKKLPSGTAQSGYSFGYEFDPIGNRKSTTTNGRAATYTPNSLNQYSERQVPGYIDLLAGTGDAANTLVTVTGLQGTVIATKQGAAFHAAVPVNNASAAQFPTLTVRGIKGGGASGTDYEQTATGKHFLPKTPETFTYDDDGNLTQDGRWSYTWDGENRLIAMETIAAAVTAGVPRLKLEFKYDYRGRRIQKIVRSGWNAGAYTVSTETRFLYDEGWNLLAEINASATVLRRYLWGADLSGDRQGAGGVGGLLCVTDMASGNSQLPFYDGNGNIVGYLDAATGSETARYEYGPFGEPLRVSGALAEGSPFRFSTKYHDNETGLLYYGYRYYQPQTGRWTNRDPIEEDGGANVYGFCENASPLYVDALGMQAIDGKQVKYIIVAAGPEIDHGPERYLDGTKHLPMENHAIGSMNEGRIDREIENGKRDYQAKTGKICCSPIFSRFRFTPSTESAKAHLNQRGHAFYLVAHGEATSYYDPQQRKPITTTGLFFASKYPRLGRFFPIHHVVAGNTNTSEVSVQACYDAGLPDAVGGVKLIKITDVMAPTYLGALFGAIRSKTAQLCPCEK